MKIIWLSPYPTHLLGDRLAWKRVRYSGHPCSWIMNLSAGLHNLNDVDLHIVTLCPWITSSQSVQTEEGYTVHVIKSGMPFVHKGYPRSLPLDALTHFKCERASIKKIVSSLNPSIVHAHGTESAYALAASDLRFPWLVSMQGVMGRLIETNPCFRYRLVNLLEKQVLKKARYVGCRTHYDRGYVSQTNPAAEVLEMPEAMNACFFNDSWQDPCNKKVLYVGNLSPAKGLHHLIQSLKKIVPLNADLELLAVGNGSDEQRSKMQIIASDSGVKVNFMGYRSSDEIVNLQKKCSVFVLSSENENSPNALVEAMVAGMPVIAFNVGGISSIIDHGINGLLVPFGDYSAMGKAIDGVLRNKQLRTRLSQNAMQATLGNHPRAVAKTTLNAYEKVISDW